MVDCKLRYRLIRGEEFLLRSRSPDRKDGTQTVSIESPFNCSLFETTRHNVATPPATLPQSTTTVQKKWRRSTSAAKQ
jgi:hypothetical protein